MGPVQGVAALHIKVVARAQFRSRMRTGFTTGAVGSHQFKVEILRVYFALRCALRSQRSRKEQCERCHGMEVSRSGGLVKAQCVTSLGFETGNILSICY